MPVKAVVFDFDSTLSTPTFLTRENQWAVADKKAIFASMNETEIIANFGGSERISALDKLLSSLERAGTVLFIVSIGYRAAFMPHLRSVGLLKFFSEERIFGQDSPQLREVEFVKGRLIANIMSAMSWTHDEVLFIDDSKEHIERASTVCKTLLVSPESKSKVGGMTATELEAIRACVLESEAHG